MARKASAKNNGRAATAEKANAGRQSAHRKQQRTSSQLFSALATRTAHLAGHPVTFVIAVSGVLVWALTGPLFNYSDTWQLVINTSTTIITFLMVFLIQHTQNRDTLAMQVKLAELILAVQQAENRLATVEDLSEEELEALHEKYRKQAEATLGHLEHRRAQLKRAS
jgi:low affinity Fe/Cu permease